MSRNLGAKNPLRQVLQVSFFENQAKVTIFIVLISLLLSVAHADKEPHQDDDVIGPRHDTQLPDLLMVSVGQGWDKGGDEMWIDDLPDTIY